MLAPPIEIDDVIGSAGDLTVFFRNGGREPQSASLVATPSGLWFRPAASAHGCFVTAPSCGQPFPCAHALAAEDLLSALTDEERRELTTSFDHEVASDGRSLLWRAPTGQELRVWRLFDEFFATSDPLSYWLYSASAGACERSGSLVSGNASTCYTDSAIQGFLLPEPAHGLPSALRFEMGDPLAGFSVDHHWCVSERRGRLDVLRCANFTLRYPVASIIDRRCLLCETSFSDVGCPHRELSAAVERLARELARP